MKLKKAKRKMGMGVLPKQRDLPKLFGNPSAPGWAAKHICYVKPPFKMWAGKLPVKAIQTNRLIEADFKAILNEIWEASGKSQDKIHAWGMDRFDGSFVVRSIRGGTAWSNHSFAMAFDFNARQNGLGVIPGTIPGSFIDSHPVVKIFKKHGWRWGGNYIHRKDGMHFEAVSG